MANHKHLTLQDRYTIESLLKAKANFRVIASALDKDPSTISKEIRAHLVKDHSTARHLNYNACKLRFSCQKSHICLTCHASRRLKLCKKCSMCNAFCKDFEIQYCDRLQKPPYVCNGCGKWAECTLGKHWYHAEEANSDYRKLLKEARSGISLSEEDIRHLDRIITPLIRQKQSPHHICLTNRDSVMVSERTIYRLIDSHLLTAINLDLPRKVRYRARKQSATFKVDRSCRIGRDYECYTAYMAEHPDTPVVQLDSVEGKKGGKVLLTVHFVKAEMMLAFLRDHNDSQSVIDIFNRLYLELRPDRFMKLFPVCLADNGSEFSNPKALENDAQDNPRTKLFYCDAASPHQKGSAERNHEFIRYFIPKGTDLAPYSQDDICLMMDHINSYGRESLGNKSPYEMFAFLYGNDILELLGCRLISPQNITLNSSIFRKEVQS